MSETEEEEDLLSQEEEVDGDQEDEEAGATPVEKALAKLTQIVGNLSKEAKKTGDLDSLWTMWRSMVGTPAKPVQAKARQLLIRS